MRVVYNIMITLWITKKMNDISRLEGRFTSDKGYYVNS